MSMNITVPKVTNWWAWGGGAAVLAALIAAAVWGFDLWGSGSTAEETAPAVVEDSQ
ncbi:MAG: hypothetical protein MRY75_09495 [Marivita sp.]|uniref:hypothetical protein n=1 Tax=Marivita sp. TaxID=2003365 RepID=UPI0025C04BB3|nr:hypothetical protein [Marivita sp.]MCI5110775.1 hypothetical protein [Marivita sp.]